MTTEARLRRVMLALMCLAASSSLAETRRLAIVVGNNAGTGAMPPLRYAESDAGKMARVLVELGDVSADDVLLLQGQTMTALERAIGEARERVSMLKGSPDVRTVLYFYFSGHSDGEALEMGREQLAYGRLKALLLGTGADVRVVVIDACRSGAGLRAKGGKPADGFVIRLADTLQATGEAFITSSAADESALESSEVMGSFFTHNFISGLRGAADASGDKQITLAEAYRYAYDRTVSSTSVLSAGAQHPNYDYRLSGQGELVLATLLKPSSVLELPVAERALVTDLARDQVVAEVVGNARELALAPGSYGIRVFKDGQSYGGRVTLEPGQRHTVTMVALSPIRATSMVAVKGGAPAEVEQRASAPTQPRSTGVGLSVGGTGRVLAPAGTAQGPKWQLRVDLEPVRHIISSGTAGSLHGTMVVLGLGEMSFDAAPGPDIEAANEAGGQVRLGYRLGWSLGPLELGVGVEVGPGFLTQLYEGRASSVSLNVDPRFTLKVRVAPAVALFASAEAAVTFVTYGETEASASFRPFVFPAVAGGVMAFF